MPNVKRKRPFVFTRTHGRRFLQMTELPTPRDEVPLARGVSVHWRPAIDRSVGRVGGEGGDSSLVRTRRTAFFVLSPERYFRVQRSVSRGGVLCNLTLTMVLLLVGLTTRNISSMHGAPFEFKRR